MFYLLHAVGKCFNFSKPSSRSLSIKLEISNAYLCVRAYMKIRDFLSSIYLTSLYLSSIYPLMEDLKHSDIVSTLNTSCFYYPLSCFEIYLKSLRPVILKMCSPNQEYHYHLGTH